LDFLRFISLRDLDNVTYRVTLNQPPALVNRMDPRRTSSGSATHLFTFKARPDGTPLYELWPHQTSRKSYAALYQRRGRMFDVNGLDDERTLPANIPESLVLEKAFIYGCKWAVKNPSLTEKSVRWGDNIMGHQKEFETLLARTIMQDKRMVEQSWILPAEDEWSPMMSAEYTRSHATYGYVL
jgi:hypothetical protein